ncbi:hypothetical protein [Acinetobacter sp.]|uniref:hypothetical protein n=1 Tax=Acinetobacter sp. TaxID=472 RepID=UPI003890F8C8
MNTIDIFEAFKLQVERTPHWKAMLKTVENTGWHREANVAVHTEMTIEVYVTQFFKHRTPRQQLMTMVGLTFHDFGKPEAEETVEVEPGVVTRRYGGHEAASAREFKYFIETHETIRMALADAGIGDDEIEAIRVMIQYHLPYNIQTAKKRMALRRRLHEVLGDDVICFYDLLRSDCAGRISDNHEEKIADVEKWIAEFEGVKLPAKRFHISWNPVYKHWKCIDHQAQTVAYGLNPTLAVSKSLEKATQSRK